MTKLSRNILPLTALLIAGQAVLPLSVSAQSPGAVISPLSGGYLSRARNMENTDNPLGTIDQLRRFETLTGISKELLLAKAYYAVGDERCVPLLRNFISSNPASPSVEAARMLLGDYYFFTHDFEESLAVYDELDLNSLSAPDRDLYSYRKALSLIKTGNNNKAISLLKRIKNSSSFAGPAQFYLAYIDYQGKRYEDAYEGFEEALQLMGKPSFSASSASDYSTPPTLNRRHYDYEVTGLEAEYYMLQIDYMRGEYLRVINAGPTLITKTPVPEFVPEMQRIIGESYFKLGRFQEARTWLEAYLSTSEEIEPSAYYSLGVITFQENEYKEAEEYFGKLNNENNALGQSAYLYLGQCAIKQQDSDLAAICFRKAYSMNFDPKVGETALYNYIAAITRGGSVPFTSSVPLLQEFVDKYPDSKYASEVEQYMAVAYYNEKDFDNALESINLISKPDAKTLTMKQKILFELGVREMSNDRPAAAEKYLEEASELARFDKKVAAQADLWLGDARYALKKYSEADKAYGAYLKSDGKGENVALAKYNLAYSLYMQDKFSEALALFDEALKSKPSLSQTLSTDALMRKADCLYYLGNLNTASDTYNRAISDGSADSDYAAMRKAVIAGVNGDNRGKIEQLNNMLELYPSSKWVATAMLEKALAYSELNEPQRAIETFNSLAKQFPDAPETRNALLQMAILQRKNGHVEEAIDSYKKIIKNWVTSEEAQVAGDDLRTLYAATGELDELASFLKSVPGAPQLDDNEVEELTYQDASTAFATTDDVTKLTNYVMRYPNGRYLAQALRDIAEYEYSDLGDADKSLTTIETLLQRRPDSQQVPGALLLKGQILENEWPERKDDILSTYREIEKRGGSSYAALAWAGIMRNTADADERIEYARRVREAGGLSAEDLDDATFYEALGLLDSGSASTGVTLLTELSESPQSLAGSKAAVRLGEYYVAKGQPGKAIELLNTFTSSGTPHQYELARGYIALADAYYAKGNKQLAREYIRSLEQNYPGDEADIANMINERLNQWK